MSKFLVLLLCLSGFLFAAVNINTATVEELQSLKGIGKSKAEAIVAYRNEQNFTSIDDIKKVKGIGPKLFESIKQDITVQ
ncbi:competence protein, ComEA family [Campylobacter avium LMG 24591]|uniref:Competence protein, ComEA family n=1 Tax=Campylobacter avium LMG 24591 TaxID=522484 RepID=A0A222MVY5_9BACT|nr:ComEA family DNA-binding protein [Campylobacter avium]ASQ29842.1 competence protein, ComEA family [Campylobacter avium LMG 24591]OYD78941.1 competence protein, ComEA family [Campylobacter avium]